tara:strand:+ start:4116 stop:4295 length:180 start_codon:yes stop_codon:yes gene_type:complete
VYKEIVDALFERNNNLFGAMVELVDTTDLKSVARKSVRVQVPLAPPFYSIKEERILWIL